MPGIEWEGTRKPLLAGVRVACRVGGLRFGVRWVPADTRSTRVSWSSPEDAGRIFVDLSQKVIEVSAWLDVVPMPLAVPVGIVERPHPSRRAC